MDINFTEVFLLAVKIILLVLLAFYFIFSLVMLGKVKFLLRVLDTEASPPILIMVLVNSVLTLVLFFLTLIIL